MPAVQEQAASRSAAHPFLRPIAKSPNKVVIAIGGHVDQSGDMDILTTLADFTIDGTLFVTTLASNEEEDGWRDYSNAFTTIAQRKNRSLNVEHIDITDDTTTVEEAVEREGEKGFLLTGGMQNLLKERLGEGGIRAIRKANEEGVVVAGTSAGAAILGPYMIVGDESTGDFYIDEGLGLVKEVIVDQHFSQKQRAPRLKKATRMIAEQTGDNDLLAVGVDEDTAAIFVKDEHIHVIGSNSVTVFEASKSHRWDEEGELTADERGIHVLSSGDIFDIKSRQKIESQQGLIIENSGEAYQIAA